MSGACGVELVRRADAENVLPDGLQAGEEATRAPGGTSQPKLISKTQYFERDTISGVITRR